MDKNLSSSSIDRQNILNNQYALAQIEKDSDIRVIEFEGKRFILKEQAAGLLGVTVRTIDNYIETHKPELSKNGYAVLRGKPLEELKKLIKNADVNENPFVNIKTPQLSVFDFRAFLNLAMLVNSEPAKIIRSRILDITINTIIQKAGGNTRYINQRDEDFIGSWFEEENYRREFTAALDSCVDMGKYKYPIYTNKIYTAIFAENTREYRKILKLEGKDKTRDTMYAEVLDLIASFESGLAEKLNEECTKLNRKLTQQETDNLFDNFAKQSLFKPLIEKARNKMASRDFVFRDALHHKLQNYIRPVKEKDFQRFIGEKSQDLENRLMEAQEVMKRLKER